MRLVFWSKHPGDLLGEPISFLTHGEVSHAGFLRANGMCHELYYPKVRDRKWNADEIAYLRIFRLRYYDWMKLQPINATDHINSQFEVCFDANLKLGTSYSVEDLFKYLFNETNSNDMSSFCSRYVEHTCQQITPCEWWPLARVQDNDWVSPAELFHSNMMEEEHFTFDAATGLIAIS